MATTKERLAEALGPRGQDAHFQSAYGKFMMAWADVEAELYRVLCAYAEVSDAVARSIFSGTRARNMMAFIEAIADNKGMEQARRDDLKHVFPQIATINTVRDFLAHHATGNSYGIDYADPTLRAFTDRQRVARYGKEMVLAMTVAMLENMASDLYAISNHLNQHWGAQSPARQGSPFRPWRENDPDDPPTPWLYKFPQPTKNRDKNPSAGRKSKGPRLSSAQRRAEAMKTK